MTSYTGGGEAPSALKGPGSWNDYDYDPPWVIHEGFTYHFLF